MSCWIFFLWALAILFLPFSQFYTALDISLCFFFFLYLKILIGRRNLPIIFLPYGSLILSGFFLSMGNLHGFCLVWNGLVTHFVLSSFLLLWGYLDWTVILFFLFGQGEKFILLFYLLLLIPHGPIPAFTACFMHCFSYPWIFTSSEGIKFHW